MSENWCSLVYTVHITVSVEIYREHRRTERKKNEVKRQNSKTAEEKGKKTVKKNSLTSEIEIDREKESERQRGGSADEKRNRVKVFYVIRSNGFFITHSQDSIDSLVVLVFHFVSVQCKRFSTENKISQFFPQSANLEFGTSFGSGPISVGFYDFFQILFCVCMTCECSIKS